MGPSSTTSQSERRRVRNLARKESGSTATPFSSTGTECTICMLSTYTPTVKTSLPLGSSYTKIVLSESSSWRSPEPSESSQSKRQR